jgi:hypothetical protein
VGDLSLGGSLVKRNLGLAVCSHGLCDHHGLESLWSPFARGGWPVLRRSQAGRYIKS